MDIVCKKIYRNIQGWATFKTVNYLIKYFDKKNSDINYGRKLRVNSVSN